MNERGFTLVEIVMAAGILAVVALSLVSGAVTSQSAAQTLDRGSLVYTRAEGYLERIMAIPFGAPSDGTATSSELSELFDDDDLLGTASVHKLRNFGAAEFTTPSVGTPGLWRVLVSDDLDGDGDADTEVEGRNDLFRITVYYDGRPVTEVLRFDPIANP